MDILLAIITIAFASLLIILARGRLKGFNPASAFTYFWTVQIILILIGWSSYMYFQYWGLLFILFGVLCFDIGYLLKPTKRLEIIQKPKYEIVYKRTSKHVYFIVMTIAVLGVAYEIYSKGFSIQNFLDLNAFIEMSAQNSLERYSGESESGLLTRLFGINAYTCPLLGGLLYYSFDKRKYLSPLTIIPITISGLSQGVKMGMISGVFLWIIGFVVSSKLLSIHRKMSLKTVMMIASGILAFMSFMIVTMMFRYGSFDIDTFFVASGKMISYGLGHLPAFDIWYVSYEEHFSDLTFGGKTIYGITNTLGILSREQGVFSEMYKISPYGDETNVFTAFRFFVEDFGSVGTWLFLFIMGYLCRMGNDSFVSKRSIHLGITIICTIYFYISWSFATSAFAYASFIMIFVYLYFLLKFVFIKKRVQLL